MSEPDSHRHLSVREGPVLSKAEIRSYLYGLPETEVPPELVTRWVAGEQFDAATLLACFRSDARRAAGSHDESLAIVRVAIERLEALSRGAPGAR